MHRYAHEDLLLNSASVVGYAWAMANVVAFCSNSVCAQLRVVGSADAERAVSLPTPSPLTSQHRQDVHVQLRPDTKWDGDDHTAPFDTDLHCDGGGVRVVRRLTLCRCVAGPFARLLHSRRTRGHWCARRTAGPVLCTLLQVRHSDGCHRRRKCEQGARPAKRQPHKLPSQHATSYSISSCRTRPDLIPPYEVPSIPRPPSQSHPATFNQTQSRAEPFRTVQSRPIPSRPTHSRPVPPNPIRSDPCSTRFHSIPPHLTPLYPHLPHPVPLQPTPTHSNAFHPITFHPTGCVTRYHPTFLPLAPPHPIQPHPTPPYPIVHPKVLAIIISRAIFGAARTTSLQLCGMAICLRGAFMFSLCRVREGKAGAGEKDD